ncbi:MAG: hypothetical protein AABZ74_06670 [Cyanobacteriota bacterium]
MKKLSLLVLVLFVTSCSSQENLSSLNQVSNDVTEVQSAKKITLNFNKKDTKETKNSESKLINKKSKGEVKKAESLQISFTAPDLKNSIDQKSIVAISRIALNSMNGAQSYESGYKMSLTILEKLASENVYIARVGLAMAKGGMYYETCFKATAATLKNISEERPNNPTETCNLISSIMSNTKSYEEGAKLGYAAMEVIGNTDNQMVKLIVDTTVSSAKAGQYWEDIYKTLQNGLNEIKRI